MLNGEELVGLDPDRVARKGMVRSFQDVRLFNRLSCLQNVMMAVQDQPGENFGTLAVRHAPGQARPRPRRREKAMGWLGFVGMAEFADVPAGALSYGQTKLVSLARVLATEADVLLLDEPASGIDTKWVDTMLDLIEQVRDQGRTVCVVEHNLHVVGRLADHTYFMELGQITAQGTIAELTNDAATRGGLLWNQLTPPRHRPSVAQRRQRRADARRPGPAGRLRPQAGRVRRRLHGPRRRDPRHPRPQRQRQEHDDPHHPRHQPGVRRHASRSTARTSPNASSRANVKAGMAMIPSERFVFQDMTVHRQPAARRGQRPRRRRAGPSEWSSCTSCSRSSSSAPASSPARCRVASSGWSASAWR